MCHAEVTLPAYGPQQTSSLLEQFHFYFLEVSEDLGSSISSDCKDDIYPLLRMNIFRNLEKYKVFFSHWASP